MLIVRDTDELDTAANELIVMDKAESVVEVTNASEATVSVTSEVVIILVALLEECVEVKSSSIDIEDVVVEGDAESVVEDTNTSEATVARTSEIRLLEVSSPCFEGSVV